MIIGDDMLQLLLDYNNIHIYEAAAVSIPFFASFPFSFVRGFRFISDFYCLRDGGKRKKGEKRALAVRIVYTYMYKLTRFGSMYRSSSSIEKKKGRQHTTDRQTDRLDHSFLLSILYIALGL